jgi:alpha-L-fucosidase
MKKNNILLLLSALLLVAGCSTAPKDYMHESSSAYEQRMEWWKDARFGMFIHWGPYAVFAGEYQGKTVTGGAEWIMYTLKIPVGEYEKVARTFNPVDFDAEKWVKTAKEAGMKYIVITSKHHDGFCMWHTKLTDYNIVDYTPFKRDVLKELADACKKEGMKLGFYYSIMDWHNPLAHGDSFPKYREEYMKPQLKELLTNYGDVAVLWFDGEWISEWTEEQGKDLYNFVRNLQPDIIINNRVGKGRKGMEGMNKGEEYAGDFGTPEQGIPSGKSNFAWETCMTMNGTWGYSDHDNRWKSPERLIHNLVDIVSKGGNFLLNVGPDALGNIPEPSVERLREMGTWLTVNGEAIYRTRAFRYYKEGEGIRYTMSKDSSTIYPVLLEWPGEQVVLESVLPDEEAGIRMLGLDEPLRWKINVNRDLAIDIPSRLQEEKNRPCRYAWALRVPGRAFPLAPAPVVKTSSGESGQKRIFFMDEVTVTISSSGDGTLHYTLDGSLPTPLSPEYQAPLTLRHTTHLRAKLFKDGVKGSFTADVMLVNTQEEHLPVIKYSYYEGEWDSLPDFTQLTPLRSGFTDRVDPDVVGPREDHFGIVYEGVLDLPKSGEYLFTLRSDDGSRLFLRGKKVIDHDGLHGFTARQAELFLKKGKAPFRLEYFEATGGDGLRWTIRPPGAEKAMPARMFFKKM